MDKPKDKKKDSIHYDGNVHVMPTDREHVESSDCWCEPKLEEDYTSQGGRKLYVHKEVH